LKGYARVDFRVDRNGSPWVLEINANPCLSHDAGFAAALATSGLDFTQAVEEIIQDGLSRQAHRAVPQAVAKPVSLLGCGYR
jgi:D-alanine-D-alanine ligase